MEWSRCNALLNEKEKHHLSSLWLWQSAVGLIGTFLNSSLLVVIFKERHSLITSVNWMIWYIYTFLICRLHRYCQKRWSKLKGSYVPSFLLCIVHRKSHGLLIKIAIYEIQLFPALIQYIDWLIQSLFNGEIF